MLPTLILSHGKKVAITRAKDFMKGDCKSLWNKCRSQAAVVDNVSASAVMTYVNDDDADDSVFDHALSEILGASSRVAPSLDLDLAFGTVDSNVDPACTPLLSPLCPFPSPLASPPPFPAAGEPI